LDHISNSYSYRSVKYWCFNCEKQFSKLKISQDTEVLCPACDCPSEEITSENDPRLFRPFIAQQSSNSTPNSQIPLSNEQAHQHEHEHEHEHHHHHHHNPQMHPAFGAFLGGFPRQPRNGRVFVPIEVVFLDGDSNLLDGLFSLFGASRPGSRTMDQIIEEFLRNDPNRYGPPPASDTAISNLKKKKFENAQESKACTVCQDDYNEQDELVEMPCGHEFHDNCVVNWLKLHNTCPVCRKAVESENVHQETNKETVN